MNRKGGRSCRRRGRGGWRSCGLPRGGRSRCKRELSTLLVYITLQKTQKELAEHPKCKVTPLVRRAYKGANKSANNHDLVNEHNPQNSRCWETGGEQQIEEEQRRCDEPVDVTNVEDLSVQASNLGIRADELDSRGCPADVGCHAEVGDRGDHGDTGGNVVEDAVFAGLCVGEAEEGDGGCGHGGADGPVEVGAADGNGYLSCPASIADDVAGVWRGC